MNEGGVDAKCESSYEALKMCAAVKRFRRTVTDRSGGDLLDLLEDGEE